MIPLLDKNCKMEMEMEIVIYIYSVLTSFPFISHFFHPANFYIHNYLIYLYFSSLPLYTQFYFHYTLSVQPDLPSIGEVGGSIWNVRCSEGWKIGMKHVRDRVGPMERSGMGIGRQRRYS